MFWSDVIEMLQALMFGVAHVCNGSVGIAVMLVSFTIRLALLPLTLRLARRAKEHQRRLRALQPELLRLQKRFEKDPAKLWQATSRLYEQRGVKPVDSANLVGGLVQAPIFAALYGALRRGLGAGVRFLWIGDTSLPNVLVTLSVAGLTAGAVAACQTPETTRSMQWIVSVLIAGTTVWFLSSASALFALSTGAGSLVGIAQGLILRRDDYRAKESFAADPGPARASGP